MSVSAARSRVNMVKEYLGNGRLDQIESTLAAAAKYLEGQPEAEAAPLRSEIEALRVQAAAMPTEPESRFVGAALRDLKAARSRMADKQYDIAASNIDRAAKYLVDVRPEHRAKAEAEIEIVRAELHAALGPKAVDAPAPIAAPAPTPVAAPAATPAPAASRALTDDEHAQQSRLRGLVRSVHNRVESRRTDGALEELDAITAQLHVLPASAEAPLRAQIDEIRAAYHKTIAAEAHRVVTSELNRHLSSAESGIETMRWHDTHEGIERVLRRLGDDDAKSALSAEDVSAYRTRIADIRTNLAAFIKQDAIGRSTDVLVELEQAIEENPFTGSDEYDVYRKKNELDRLHSRVLGGIRHADASDPDIAAIAKRAAAAEQTVDAALLAWSKAALDANVSNSWIAIETDIAGWSDEQDTQRADGLHEPELPKTRQAIHRTRWLLEAEDTKSVRAAHPDDAAVQGPFLTAERTRSDASAKLAEAYSRVLAHAESLPTPLSQLVLARPNLLAYSAESDLAGTPFQHAVVGRARALDERWKIEVAAIYKQRQELYDKLDAEANEVWPDMRDAMGAESFDPDAARPGMLVRFDEVYNRCGWEYGSRAYSFAIRQGNVVIGGTYEPHVLAALEHAWYELKLAVNDRIVWDVIGEIVGVDKIGMRTTVTLRDASSGAKLGEIEEWPPIDCVRIRIVALRAGPVAVTPTSPWAPAG